ncbi:MAG TPA: ABC transporter permease [Vicinamibacterales bacterium]|nr:ABC transporter permease [Vicinamibacterales bacterium]
MSSLKFALRTLFKTPFVTIIAIVSLALGIGANAAIFSCFNQMLLQAVPVPKPAELVNLSAPGPKPGSQSCNQAGDCDAVFSYSMFRDLQKTQTVFTGIAAHRLFGANLAYQGQTMNGEGLMVSGNYFQVLQVQPALGRLFDSNDDRLVGEAQVAVLSHAYWTQRFAADPGVLNQGLIVNGQTLTVVGVAAQGFDGTTLGSKPQVFVPITLRGTMNPGFKQWANRQTYWAYLFARLRPGVTIDSARSALNAQYHAIVNDVEAPLQRGMSDATLAKFRAKPITVEPGGLGQSSTRSVARTPLLLLLSVTGFVLLIACANIANLLLARSAARSSEMALRLSLGAGRARLIGQLLTESLMLATFGGLAGLLVANWTLRLIMSLMPAEAAKTMAFSISGPALLFAGALTIGTGILFGLFPALHSTRPDLVSTLKNQAGQPSGARGAKYFRLTLATTQIALSMMLLASSGFFVKSLLNVSRVDLGLKIDNVITFGLSPELSGYTAERSRLFFERLEDELRATPGVTGVTVSLVPLLAGSNWGNDVNVQGFQSGPDTDNNSRFNEVGPGYFSTLGVPLMAGREFTAADGAGAPKVAIVNEEFAKKFGLGRDAVGKLMGSGSGNRSKLDTLIVGVAQNAKYSDVKRVTPPVFFRPYRQDRDLGSAAFYVRTAADPSQSASAITAVVRRLDPNLPVEDLKTLTQQVRDNTFLDRMMTTLSSLFAGLATLLAGIGLYGVLAYTVSQRTREIGLRMALGAAPSRVRAMVMRQVAWMTVVGAIAGLGGAVYIGLKAGSLLYEMKGSDPGVLAVSAVALSAVALLAGFVPAHRASRVDPMVALRYE